MKVVELFAGVGGFRCGLEADSKEWETVWYSQWEPSMKIQHAYNCYASHFGELEHANEDIATVDKTTIPDHDLLVGGFPCQDYSVAHSLNSSKGIEGKKGVLWWQINEILSVKQPRFGLFENVDRLLKSPASQRGRDFGIMLACLNNLGYSVEWRVINAAEYGGPQRRRRTFIFIRKGAYDASEMRQNGVLVCSFPVVSTDVPVTETSVLTDDLAQFSDTFSFAFGNAGVMTGGTVYSYDVEPITETPINLGEILEQGADEKYYISDDKLPKWQYQKGAKKIERTAKNGHKYTFSEGPVAFPDKLDAPARTMLTSEGTLNRSSHIVLDPWTHRYRILTPIECEKIQGFPRNWTNTMPDRARYFCMGNALVVPMITRIAPHIRALN